MTRTRSRMGEEMGAGGPGHGGRPSVIPAKAGIHAGRIAWIPAFAGMTARAALGTALTCALLLPAPLAAQSASAVPNGLPDDLLGIPASPSGPESCRAWAPEDLTTNPTQVELRCRWGVIGSGRFGLLSYLDVPVYQTTTPMPGTHLVGLHGHARPRRGESYEGWEWRILRTEYGPEVRRARRSLALMHPFAASRIISFEAVLKDEGVRAIRRETWRSPERQAYLFQQGRSRPGPLATTTLTSWHSEVDAAGNPAGRAVDYTVRQSQMVRFHEIAQMMGLATFGANSNDPGHVFVPGADPVEPSEVVLLRLLPRVPVVTLATGLPVDMAFPTGGRMALRAAVQGFLSAAFVPRLEASMVRMRAPAGIVEWPGGFVR